MPLVLHSIVPCGVILQYGSNEIKRAYINKNCTQPIKLLPAYYQSCSSNKREKNLIARAALAVRAEKFLLPEQKWIQCDVHARPVGGMYVCMYV